MSSKTREELLDELDIARCRIAELELALKMNAEHAETVAWLEDRMKNHDDFIEICGDVFHQPGVVEIHIRYRVGRHRAVIDTIGPTFAVALGNARTFLVENNLLTDS